jgi:hypothetical protein
MKIEEIIVDGIPIRKIIYEDSDFPTQEQKSTWLDTCNSCEYKKNERCGYCGCIIESLMMLKTGKCPLEKW